MSKLKITNENKAKIFKSIVILIVLLISTLIVCIPMIKHPNMAWQENDGIQHIARFIGMEDTFKQGEFLPLIMSNLCNGFGYSWNIFYSPLTDVVPLLLRLFALNFDMVLKISMAIATFLSGYAMFRFIKKVSNSNKTALFGACLYILAPYRLSDIYLRHAFAELVSFIFLPMVMSSLYGIFAKKEKGYLLAISASLLILTHTIITAYFAVICFIYLIVNIKKLKEKDVLKTLLKNILVIILLTAFFIVPFMEHKLATDYEVFNFSSMIREDILMGLRVDPLNLLITTDNDFFVFDIGLITIVGVVFGLLAFGKLRKENSDFKKLYVTLLIFGILFLILSLNIFPFDKMPQLLKMIQFTYRFLEFTSFIFAFIAAINIYEIVKDVKFSDYIYIALIIVAMLNIYPYSDKVLTGEFDETRLYGEGMRLTEYTGRVHGGMATLEYLPSKAYNNREYIIKRKDQVVSDNEYIEIKDYNKQGDNFSAKLFTVKKGDKIELPYIYYLGYRISLNGNELDKYNESQYGFIEIIADQDYDELEIKSHYLGTNKTLIAYGISTLTVMYLIAYYITRKNKQLD